MNSKLQVKHTGEAPSRRPPDDEPEHRGEGELGSDEEAPAGEVLLGDEDYAKTETSARVEQKANRNLPSPTMPAEPVVEE